MNLYEYSVIRFVPDVEREEFINVGLIMMCKRRRWLRIATSVNSLRVNSLSPDVSTDTINWALETFTAVAGADRAHGPIAMLEPEERFRWLTAVKSACLQTSRPHCGLTDDLEATFERLLNRLVL